MYLYILYAYNYIVSEQCVHMQLAQLLTVQLTTTLFDSENAHDTY